MADGSACAEDPAPHQSLTARGRTALEVGVVFVVATAVVALLWRAQGVPLVRDNLHALVAVLFLLVPHVVLRGRADVARYGFTARPVKLSLVIAAVGIFVLLPLFAAGAALWVPLACKWAPVLSPVACVRGLHAQLRLPPDFAMLAASQVIVVGLPEELFFRGYIQGRLEDAWPARRRLFGAPVGAAWLVSSVLFGLGHFLVRFDATALSRFVPGLVFGWMFARTRSILAGTLFHAACNLLMEVFGTSWQG